MNVACVVRAKGFKNQGGFRMLVDKDALRHIMCLSGHDFIASVDADTDVKLTRHISLNVDKRLIAK